MEDEYAPPSHPPPFLKLDQLCFLSQQGWLPVELPEPLLSDLQLVSADAASFFTADVDEKKTLYPSSHGTECGYYVVPEEKEYITFRHRLHPESQLEQHVRSAWGQAANLLHRVLCDLGKFYSYDPRFWDSMLEGTSDLSADAKGMDDNTTLMRLFQYYPGGVAEPHIDIGLLTLCMGDGKGLELLDRRQTPTKYVPARGPTILVGGMASVLLNGKTPPGKHRVVGNPQGRSSIIFTVRPCLKADIDLSLLGGEGTVSAREVYMKSKATRYNINATKDIREKQRQDNEEARKQVAETLDSSHEEQQISAQPPGQYQQESGGLRPRFSGFVKQSFKKIYCTECKTPDRPRTMRLR